MNYKTEKLVNLIFYKLKNNKNVDYKLSKNDVEKFISYLIENN